MRKRLYFVGVMAQVGTFSTIALLLWWMTKMDVLKLFCISAVVSSMISLPILMQIERWVNGVE
jgi:Mg2+/citrate symporter